MAFTEKGGGSAALFLWDRLSHVVGMSRRNEVSAGLLVYRRSDSGIEYLLAHPGGPFWQRKDLGAWTIPKGLVEPGHELLATARREFLEETGLVVEGPVSPLPPVKQKSGKVVHGFALEASLDLARTRSNSFEMEWPPRSGRRQAFPEIDRVGYFAYEEAIRKIIPYQQPFLLELNRMLNAEPSAGRDVISPAKRLGVKNTS
jgi:predicted NUDIX family NTP pyrophosphohydrolase